MKEEEKQIRIGIYKEIVTLIKDNTNYSGDLNAKFFKKELEINVFPEIEISE